MSPQKFSVVINHYSFADAPPHLKASTLLSASLSIQSPLVSEVIVVDGSLTPDPELQNELGLFNCQYIHAGKRLTFSEGYNLGASAATERWVVLCASDVYPSLTIYDDLSSAIQSIGSDRIGCLIPHLTSSDYPAQQHFIHRKTIRKTPVMTLNFNVFEREFFNTIGGVPNDFTGNYNDVVMAMRIYEQRRNIFLLPNICTHFGRLTISTGNSTTSVSKDKLKFFELYPAYKDIGNLWDVDISKISDNSLLKFFTKMSRLLLPAPLRQKILRLMIRLI